MCPKEAHKMTNTSDLALHLPELSDWINAVMFLSFRTDWSGQTVQTQIRLLLEEQSDQGLHSLQFWLHLLDALL